MIWVATFRAAERIGHIELPGREIGDISAGPDKRRMSRGRNSVK